MPSRKTPLVNNYYYHIFSRGVEKRNIFESKRDYRRLFETLIYYRLKNPPKKLSLATESDKESILHSGSVKEEKLINVYCYCLMPNHFHLLVRQLVDDGISTFIFKSLNSYTRYFNTKYDRIGPLFQGRFKSVLVETDEQLIHLSRYIHLNPYVAELVEDPSLYDWSSFFSYVTATKNALIDKDLLMSFFPDTEDYRKFVMAQKEYLDSLKEIDKLLIDTPGV